MKLLFRTMSILYNSLPSWWKWGKNSWLLSFTVEMSRLQTQPWFGTLNLPKCFTIFPWNLQAIKTKKLSINPFRWKKRLFAAFWMVARFWLRWQRLSRFNHTLTIDKYAAKFGLRDRFLSLQIALTKPNTCLITWSQRFLSLKHEREIDSRAKSQSTQTIHKSIYQMLPYIVSC